MSLNITMQWNDYCSCCNKFMSKGCNAFRLNSKTFCAACASNNTSLINTKNYQSCFSRIGAKWTVDENKYLENHWNNGTSLETITENLKRTENGIRERIKLLDLVSKTGRELPPSIYQIKLLEKVKQTRQEKSQAKKQKGG